MFPQSNQMVDTQENTSEPMQKLVGAISKLVTPGKSLAWECGPHYQKPIYAHTAQYNGNFHARHTHIDGIYEKTRWH